MDTLARSIITIVSAFVGAFFAFRYNSKLDQRKSKREKLEQFSAKLFTFSRATKKYIRSFGIEKGFVVINEELGDEARELIYECESLKILYFHDCPFDSDKIHIELERLAGRCQDIYMRLSKLPDHDFEDELSACSAISSEIQGFDEILKPIIDWCINSASELHGY